NTCDNLRKEKNDLSNSIGILMREKKIDDVNKTKDRVKEINETLITLEKEEVELENELKHKMMVIPNIIDESVPIGKDDTENVEIKKYLENKTPTF
ncbi:MAG: serine--tRNA ligase, partial [Bacilli bacterium]